MSAARPKILVVDDEPFNVDFLQQELDDLGYDTVTAADGGEAIEQVRATAPDLVLLDIMMPVMDGFAVLQRLKADPATRDIPVVIISAMNDIGSIVKGILKGADDYLPKPFEPVLLQARIRTGIDRKLQRDRELEYLRQVERLTAVAESVQASVYDEATLAPVASRDDALGNLARVFRKMAQEVVAREQRLKQQLNQLQLDIEEHRTSAGDTAAVYIPMDRRQALAHGESLPEAAQGTALFADISGFTPLTESFARELGMQRGAEEVTRQVNRVHAVLIDCVHRYGGSATGFGGDAITCWFEDDDGLRAVACALVIQEAMRQFESITAPGGMVVSIGVKVAIAQGAARRLLVGDPETQVFDVLGGRMLDVLAAAEHHAKRGEVVVTRALAEALGERVAISAWRGDRAFARIDALNPAADPAPWSAIAAGAIRDDQSRAWLPPAVYEKVTSRQSAYLSELRPAALLFLHFGGIDYDADPGARRKLDAFVRWVQRIVTRHDGTFLQLTIGDKGSSIYVAFGAPLAHHDDPLRAVQAALQLQAPPADIAQITDVAAGVAFGQVRTGAYGSPAQRAYSVIGDRANLAARLMMLAAPNTTLCDDAVYAATRGRIAFEALPPLAVKGKSQPVSAYRPLAEPPTGAAFSELEPSAIIDRLTPAEQLTLKTASVIGNVFALRVLSAVHPDRTARPDIALHLGHLSAAKLIAPAPDVPDQGEAAYTFVSASAREAAYGLMLFAQRRQLHRAVAEWFERNHAADLAPHCETLAYHWRAADEPAKAIHYLEEAGEQARHKGAYEEAQRLFAASLAIDTTAAVLSGSYAATRE